MHDSSAASSHDFDPIRRAVRIGVLGAARIAPKALVEPARGLARVVAIGARSLERAEEFARRHGIDRAYGDYEGLLSDEEVDLVYVALPAGLHAKFAERALELGKHVLVEKPFGLDEAECRRLVEHARRARLFLAEAQHSRLHPLKAPFQRALARVGTLERVRLFFNGAVPEDDIRFDPSLGGGVLMDFGCYLVEWAMWFGGAPGEPAARVEESEIVEGPPGIDRRVTARLRLPHDGSFPVELECDMRPGVSFEAGIDVSGSRGRVFFDNPLALAGSSLTVEIDGAPAEHLPGVGATTFRLQLEEVVRALGSGRRDRASEDTIVRTQAVLDAIYRKAGLPTRQELRELSASARP